MQHLSMCQFEVTAQIQRSWHSDHSCAPCRVWHNWNKPSCIVSVILSQHKSDSHQISISRSRHHYTIFILILTHTQQVSGRGSRCENVLFWRKQLRWPNNLTLTKHRDNLTNKERLANHDDHSNKDEILKNPLEMKET